MWAQVANAFLGIWLMAAPTVLEYDGAARINDLIAGRLRRPSRLLRYGTFAVLWEKPICVSESGFCSRLGFWGTAIG
jgi:hypothetical protein